MSSIVVLFASGCAEMEKAYIGVGAGFAGDRTDAADPVVAALAACDGPRFLMFETLAERTLALLQLDRQRDPQRGYNPALDRFLAPILARCLESGIRIVGNFGAANPRAAADHILVLARELGMAEPRIGLVEGDNLVGILSPSEFSAREIDGNLLRDATKIIAANVYLGAAPIVQALDRGAEIVVTGRVADSALALGPLMHVFGWAADDGWPSSGMRRAAHRRLLRGSRIERCAAHRRDRLSARGNLL
jgi:hypothetical protein